MFPKLHWLVADGLALPFPDNTFDALFAGEIIEHMPSISSTLKEWRRLLKPGGALILTTPNRGRLMNRINHSRRPVSNDHINELSFREAAEALTKAGFDILEQRGFYLEAFLTWWARGAKIDFLQDRGNRENFVPRMKLANRLGHVFPGLAFGMIIVAAKSA